MTTTNPSNFTSISNKAGSMVYRKGTSTASTSFDTHSTGMDLCRGTNTPVPKDMMAPELDSQTPGRPKSMPIPTNGKPKDGELSDYEWIFEVKRLAMLSLIQKVIPDFDDEELKDKDSYYQDEEEEEERPIREVRKTSIWRSWDEEIVSQLGWEDNLKRASSSSSSHEIGHTANSTPALANLGCDYDVSFEIDMDNQKNELVNRNLPEKESDHDDNQFSFDDI